MIFKNKYYIAQICEDFQSWNKNGYRRRFHRNDGPAYIFDGAMFWYKNGQAHRTRGPAIVEGQYKVYCRFSIYVKLFIDVEEHMLHIKNIIT